MNATKAQQAYVTQYNCHAREKEFEVGNLVLVLMADDSRKTVARWLGPGTVTDINPPHSYRVAMGDGSAKILHANSLETFVARVDSISVIFDDDVDFGQIECAPTVGEDAEEAIRQLDLS